MTQLRVADEKRSGSRRSEPLKINFTKQAIGRLRIPKDRREYTYGTKTAGLAICVTPTGTRTFYLYRRIRNRPQRVRIGLFPETSIEQARRLTTAIAARINDGADPNVERREVRAETVLSEAFAVYLETEAKPHLRSWREYERSFDIYLKGLHSRPLSSITTDDVRAVHVRIAGQGKCARLLASGTRSVWDSVTGPPKTPAATHGTQTSVPRASQRRPAVLWFLAQGGRRRWDRSRKAEPVGPVDQGAHH